MFFVSSFFVIIVSPLPSNSAASFCTVSTVAGAPNNPPEIIAKNELLLRSDVLFASGVGVCVSPGASKGTTAGGLGVSNCFPSVKG